MRLGYEKRYVSWKLDFNKDGWLAQKYTFTIKSVVALDSEIFFISYIHFSRPVFTQSLSMELKKIIR